MQHKDTSLMIYAQHEYYYHMYKFIDMFFLQKIIIIVLLVFILTFILCRSLYFLCMYVGVAFHIARILLGVQAGVVLARSMCTRTQEQIKQEHWVAT
jgi:hypothetical protein